MKNNKFKGFTLIELAVVLLVIGILAGLVVRNYSGFTSSARDTRRLADLRNITNLLAAYYVGNNIFPDRTFAGAAASWTNDFANLLVSNGILANSNELPKDPQNNNNFYYRYYTCDRDVNPNGGTYGTGSAYILAARLETPTSNQAIYRESATGNIQCLNQSGLWTTRDGLGCYPSTTLFCLYVY
ncbi:MAG: hypothetical protein KatS3mg094_467 [Candidatus Parcubacteria bacterium]|nr:MAG: hypothetical protein KatS3mg094_467 [Candidatus Parcubacteria bacterium]